MNDLGCSCIIDYGHDCDPPDCFSEKMVTARKEHKCCECGEAIKPGEKYEKATGVWDGKWDTFKTCFLCVRVRNAYCCTWEYGGLRETLWDALGIDYITGDSWDDDDDEEPEEVTDDV